MNLSVLSTSACLSLVGAFSAQAAPVEISRVATIKCAGEDGVDVATLYDVTYQAGASHYVWRQLMFGTQNPDTMEPYHSEWHVFDYKTNTGFGFTSTAFNGHLTFFVTAGAAAPVKGQTYPAKLGGRDHLPRGDFDFDLILQCKIL